MKDWIFLGNPQDCGNLVDLLIWQIQIKAAQISLTEARLRDCAAKHVAWLEETSCS